MSNIDTILEVAGTYEMPTNQRDKLLEKMESAEVVKPGKYSLTGNLQLTHKANHFQYERRITLSQPSQNEVVVSTPGREHTLAYDTNMEAWIYRG